jgi:hypothetical protein
MHHDGVCFYRIKHFKHPFERNGGNMKPKHLKCIPTVKIVVKRVYSEGKPMDKAFSDYLSQQIDKKGA